MSSLHFYSYYKLEILIMESWFDIKALFELKASSLSLPILSGFELVHKLFVLMVNILGRQRSNFIFR